MAFALTSLSPPWTPASVFRGAFPTPIPRHGSTMKLLGLLPVLFQQARMLCLRRPAVCTICLTKGLLDQVRKVFATAAAALPRASSAAVSRSSAALSGAWRPATSASRKSFSQQQGDIPVVYVGKFGMLGMLECG